MGFSRQECWCGLAFPTPEDGPTIWATTEALEEAKINPNFLIFEMRKWKPRGKLYNSHTEIEFAHQKTHPLKVHNSVLLVYWQSCAAITSIYF